MGGMGGWQIIADSEAYSLANYASPPWMKLLGNNRDLYRRGQVVAAGQGGYAQYVSGGWTSTPPARVYLSADTRKVEVTAYFSARLRVLNLGDKPVDLDFRVQSQTWAGLDIPPATTGTARGMVTVEGGVPGADVLRGAADPGIRMVGVRSPYAPERPDFLDIGVSSYFTGTVVHTFGGAPSRQQVIQVQAQNTVGYADAWCLGFSAREVI